MSARGEMLPSGEEYLAATVARRYYLGEENQTDIGKSMGLSRFKVARLLTLAREMGIVTIEITDPPSALDPLAVQLRERFDLKSCVVVRSGSSDDQDAARFVGEAGARVLEAELSGGDVLGLPWSRAVSHAINSLDSLPDVSVVQLCGSMILPGDGTPYDVVRQAGNLVGGPSHYYQAPLIMPSPEGAQAVKEQVDVAKAMDQIPEVGVVLCSVGGWEAGASTVYDALNERERQQAAQSGAVGEMMGVLFDADGRVIHTELTDRIVGISGAQLAAVPTVIAMCRGVQRANSVRAAIAGGLLTHLVADEELAHELLKE